MGKPVVGNKSIEHYDIFQVELYFQHMSNNTNSGVDVRLLYAQSENLPQLHSFLERQLPVQYS